jgi:hypothetical protein
VTSKFSMSCQCVHLALALDANRTSVFAQLVHQAPEEWVGRAVFQDFLPQALKSGQVKPALPIKVVGHGLEVIQDALNELKKGVSASKLVVTLQ